MATWEVASNSSSSAMLQTRPKQVANWRSLNNWLCPAFPTGPHAAPPAPQGSPAPEGVPRRVDCRTGREAVVRGRPPDRIAPYPRDCGPSAALPAFFPRHRDAIVIGGGHNGLTTAAYLARAGKSVLVLERRHCVGACARRRTRSGAHPRLPRIFRLTHAVWRHRRRGRDRGDRAGLQVLARLLRLLPLPPRHRARAGAAPPRPARVQARPVVVHAHAGRPPPAAGRQRRGELCAAEQVFCRRRRRLPALQRHAEPHGLRVRAAAGQPAAGPARHPRPQPAPSRARLPRHGRPPPRPRHGRPARRAAPVPGAHDGARAQGASACGGAAAAAVACTPPVPRPFSHPLPRAVACVGRCWSAGSSRSRCARRWPPTP